MAKQHKGLGGVFLCWVGVFCVVFFLFWFGFFLMEDTKEAFAMRGRSQKAGKAWKGTISKTFVEVLQS